MIIYTCVLTKLKKSVDMFIRSQSHSILFNHKFSEKNTANRKIHSHQSDINGVRVSCQIDVSDVTGLAHLYAKSGVYVQLLVG